MDVLEHCPTCGAPVKVVSDALEGTSHYRPLRVSDSEDGALSQQLAGAVAAGEVERLRAWLAYIEELTTYFYKNRAVRAALSGREFTAEERRALEDEGQ